MLAPFPALQQCVSLPLTRVPLGPKRTCGAVPAVPIVDLLVPLSSRLLFPRRRNASEESAVLLSEWRRLLLASFLERGIQGLLRVPGWRQPGELKPRPAPPSEIPLLSRGEGNRKEKEAPKQTARALGAPGKGAAYLGLHDGALPRRPPPPVA